MKDLATGLAVYFGFSPVDLSELHSWTWAWYTVGSHLVFVKASLCLAYYWHSATDFPSHFSCLIAKLQLTTAHGYGHLCLDLLFQDPNCCPGCILSTWISAHLLCWQKKCLLLLNLIFWAPMWTRAVSWLESVCSPQEALKMMKHVPAGCRHMERLRKQWSYSPENITSAQKWGLLLVGSCCF